MSYDCIDAVMTKDNYFDITKSLRNIGKENIYCFVMFDNDTAKFNKNSGYTLINELGAKNINVSLISNPIKQNNYDYGMSLTKETGGIFINTNFTYEKDDDIPNKMYNHIFGNDCEGTEYNVILIDPLSYSTIKLRKPITDEYFECVNNYTFNSYDRIKNTKNMVDSDGDNLYDFEEIRFFWDKEKNDPAITLENKEVKFPSLAEVSNRLKKEYNYIENFSDDLDTLISDKDMNVEVLPILSHPMREDGDGDGITDYNERVAIEEYKEYLVNKPKTDARQYYECSLDPMKKDTVETIVNVEVKKNVNNNYLPKYGYGPVSVEVVENEIKISANVLYNYYYLDDKNNTKVITSLSNKLDKNNNYTKVINRISKGIKDYWEGLYNGTKFDFYPGMEIKVTVELKPDNKNNPNKYININFFESCGRSHANFAETAFSTSQKYINLYRYSCSKTKNNNTLCAQNFNISHHEKGKKCSECTKNKIDRVNTTEKHLKIEFLAAHEFGHILGLPDQYFKGKANRFKNDVYYQAYKLVEIPETEIMSDSNDPKVNVNDIEMVLMAAIERKSQSFIHNLGDNVASSDPNATNTIDLSEIVLSKAIRTPIVIIKYGSNVDNVKYLYIDKYSLNKNSLSNIITDKDIQDWIEKNNIEMYYYN